MVEFALILPILLLLIFGILEYGRLFFAWISVENAARVGARYASTGRYDQALCPDLDNGAPNDDGEGAGVNCGGLEEDAEKDAARVATIKKEASGLVFGNPIIQGVADNMNSYYNVTVCSANTDDWVFTRPTMGGDIYSECQTTAGDVQETAAQPGENVIVSVDYNFPFIVTNWFRGQDDSGYFHLGSYKQASVEQFRVSRAVNIDPNFLPPDLPTPTPLPTSTPDCSGLHINNFYIQGDRLHASVSNDRSDNMPLTNANLTWNYVGGKHPRVNWFEWTGRRFYDGDGYNSPTSITCTGDQCDFPAGQTYEWVADFNGATNPLFGEFKLKLTFAGHCDLESDVVIVATPTPDCDLIEVQKVWYKNDDFRVKVKNNNHMDLPLKKSSLVWNQYPANAYINSLYWNWKKYNNGDSYTSPFDATCTGENCSFPGYSSRVWLADFDHLPLNRTTGSHEVTLEFDGFADTCEKTVSLEGNCDDLSITSALAVEDYPPNDSRLVMGITNANSVPMLMDKMTITWPPTLSFYTGTPVWGGIWQGMWSSAYGWQGYTGDWDGVYTSPAVFTDPLIFGKNALFWWSTGMNGINPPPPMYGDFGIEMEFEGGRCTISDTVTVASPTPTFTPSPTPTPDCDLLTINNFRVGSSSGHGDDDNVWANVRNDNPMPMNLTGTTFTWENPYGHGIDWFEFGNTRYYDGNSYHSPTSISDSNVSLPGNGTTYLWNTDFTGWDYPLYGDFALELVFESGPYSCTVSDSFSQGTPTPTFTPTITRTPSNTPTPTDTLTPSPTPDCDDIVAGAMHVGTGGARDNLRMNVTNNNPQPVQLTFTNFTWTNYYGNGVDWLKFGGSQYYGGNDYTSPTTRSSSIWLPAGSTYTWDAEFTGYSYPLYGPYNVTLTFEEDARCSVSGSYSRNTPTITPTYTKTLTPTPTFTFTPTKTSTNTLTPTNTFTPRPTSTITDTPVVTDTFTPSPTATIDWD